MRDETHEGWSNYSTWLVNSYITNDKELNKYFIDITKEIKDSNSDYPAVELADRIKDFLDEYNVELEDSRDTIKCIFKCLLEYALEQVNYIEIAKAWLADLKYKI